MKHKLTAVLALTLAVLMLSACADPSKFSDKERLSGKVSRSKDITVTFNYADGTEEAPSAYNSFAIGATELALKELTQTAKAEDSSFVFAPSSSVLQLGMLANAASSDLRQEISIAMGNLSVEDLNTCSSYFKSRLENVSKANKNTKADIKLSGALFADDNIDIKTSFLQNVKDFYGYDVFRFDYNGKNAQKKLRGYNKGYDGDFPLTEGTLELLSSSGIHDTWLRAAQEMSGVFSGANGAQNTDFFTADAQLLHSKTASGAVVYTADNPLKLVLVMPNEGISLSDFLNTFNSDEYTALLNSADITKTGAANIPAFSLDADRELHRLSSVLPACGLPTLFTEKAGFSALSYHADTKLDEMFELRPSFILDRNGINAEGLQHGAAEEQAAAPADTLTFDRPFIFMLADNETGIPVQAGIFRG